MMLNFLRRTLESATLTGLLATAAVAQAKPDFTGTWLLLNGAAASAAPTLLSEMWTSPFMLTQSSDTISVHASGVKGSEKYLLDDADHRVNASDVAHAGWKENTIVIRVTHSTESVPTIITQSLTMDGDQLIIRVVPARGTRQLPRVTYTYVRYPRI